MKSRVMTFVLAGFVLSISGAWFSKSLADDAFDCLQFENPDLQIQGCTGLIKEGRLGDALADAYYLRGLAYQKKGKLKEAASDATQGIRIQPGKSRHYALRVKANEEICVWAIATDSSCKVTDQIMADLDTWLKIEPGNKDAIELRATQFAMLGQTDKAISECAQLAKINSTLGAKCKKGVAELNKSLHKK